jgi:hypothetical protein
MQEAVGRRIGSETCPEPKNVRPYLKNNLKTKRTKRLGAWFQG